MLPTWIDREAWNGFVEMRRHIKKALTARAMELVIHRLIEYRKKGHDPNAVLDQSTLNNWQGLYPVKGEVIPNLVPETYQGDAPMTAEEKARADAARELAMSAFKTNLRRVA